MAEHAFSVGCAVMVRADLYEGPDDYHPGGYLAKRGDKLIVREVRPRGEWTIAVSHEDRTDGLMFVVADYEIEPYTSAVTGGAQG